MNEKSTILLVLVIVMFGLCGFILYDAKTNNRLGFGKDQPKNNWQWEDDWNKTNPIESPKPPVQPPEVKPEKPTQPQEQIVATSYVEAIKKAAEVKMEVLVFFEADWCNWCQKLKKETLTDPKVKEAMKKYIVVHVNTDQDRSTGKKFGVKYLPSYVVTNAQEQSIKADGGFKTPDQFIQWLNGGGQTQPPGVQPNAPQAPPERERPKLFPRRPQMCSDISE